jgi:6-phosphogluconolactonase
MEPDTAESNVFVFDTPEQLALAAAEQFVEYAVEFQNALGQFSVALAGGKTPRGVFELLATDQYQNRLEWSRVHLFFTDERCVPPTHPDSNYAMVFKALISKVRIPAQNVFRMVGEGDPDESARNYEAKLRGFFGPDAWPRFDLVLLGLGADGHTASLFPGSEALTETRRWVVATQSEHLGHRRITLTAPAINQAAHVLFLVTGKAKAAALAELLGGQSDFRRLPASLIQPADGTLEWFVDREAASLL